GGYISSSFDSFNSCASWHSGGISSDCCCNGDSDSHAANESRYGERHEVGYRGDNTSDANSPMPAPEYREGYRQGGVIIGTDRDRDRDREHADRDKNDRTTSD